MRKGVTLILSIILSFALKTYTYGQTDTEFWFAAPRVTTGHGTGGIPIFIRMAAGDIAADVTISIPANPGFEPLEIHIPANTAHNQNISALRNSFENVDIDTVLNKGIFIQSTNLITAYYEVGTHLNPDIFALKGRNALGEEFFVPFQNFFSNGSYNPQPYSSIVIVARDDNTSVTITPTKQAYPNRPANVPFTINLNRGQTFVVTPDSVLSGNYMRPGQRAENRLTGTHVVSNKPIAITTADDSVRANEAGYGCRDLIGDQIVPFDILGHEYIAMRGRLHYPGMQESFYVIATQPATRVFVDGVLQTTINAGESYRHQFTEQTHYVRTLDPDLNPAPVYVYHVAGFGCEMGGALLPPISVCTGSTQVAFTRSKAESFFLNILVRAGAEYGFTLNGDGPNTIINDENFNAIPGTDQWLAGVIELSDVDDIPVGVASLIQNNHDVFHLGIINGGPSSGTMYGYFSDFNMLDIQGVIADIGTDIQLFCHGYPIQLLATGGTQYLWDPPDFLNNPTIANPIALPDTTIQYTVTVSGACDMIDQASVTLVITDPVEAVFVTDRVSGCSPLDVKIFDHSIGVTIYSWRFGDGQTSNISMNEFTYRYINETDEPQEYQLKLVGRSPYFCVDTMYTYITVKPEVKAAAEANIIEGCAPLTVDFDNLSTGANEYIWRFGDGGATTSATPSHTFHNYSDKDTTYTVILKARSEFGCVDHDTLYVNVLPYLRGGFSIEEPKYCSPVSVEFTNTSIGTTSYLWDFDDGQEPYVTTETSFFYDFENDTDAPIIHQITLYVENDFGCFDEVIKELTILPNVKSGFSIDAEAQGCNPHNVNFSNESLGASSFIWKLGAGQGESYIENPEHLFVNSSSVDVAEFDVQLIAVSEFGCKDTSDIIINVFPRVEADFTFDYAEFCAPEQVSFKNVSIGGSIFEWDFGDGSSNDTANDVVTHTFSNAGDEPITYNVVLLIENDYGCISEKEREIVINPEINALFTMEASGCHPLVVDMSNVSTGANNFYWEFGDGGSSSSINPIRTFFNDSHVDAKSYTITLNAESDFGCIDSYSAEVIVYPKPLADFTPDISQGCAPIDIEFQDLAIGASDYFWNFGDGNELVTSSGNQRYTYFNPGESAASYMPQLIVENRFGCLDTIVKSLNVFPEITALFELTQHEGCHPLELEITNASEGATASNPYNWFYGDGTSSSVTSQTHAHIFKNFSHTDIVEYDLLLTAISEYGCRDSTIQTVTVNPKPKALFESPDEAGCSPFLVNFDDLSVGANQYTWDFGDDSQPGQSSDVSHTFVQPHSEGIGWFLTTLNVENEFGCSDSFSKQVKVYPNVNARFRGNMTGCHPHTVNFENISNGGQLYQWDFGNDNFSNQENPVHEFFNNSHTNNQNYNVTLDVVSEFGCEASFNRVVTVHPVPKSQFNVNETQGCSPFNVMISNLSEGGSSFYWEFGNGASQTANTLFYRLYENQSELPDTHNIILNASNSHGCSSNSTQSVVVFPEVTAEFTTESNVMEGCTPLHLSFVNQSHLANQYIWDFGDGITSTNVNPTNLFITPGYELSDYSVSLEAISQYGCSDIKEENVRVYPQPMADFSVMPYEQFFPSTTVEVSNLSSAGNWLFKWDMGDGVTFSTTDRSPFEYTYEWTEGEYQTRYYDIGLIVENPYCYNGINKQIMIKAPHPIVGFSPSAQGCPPFEVQFNNQSMYGISYFWDFGDGSTSTAINPSHIFEDPGRYFVKLLVEGEGGVDSAFQTITVFHPPIADFRVEPTEVQLPYESVKMINLSSLGSTYEWHFGDGNMSFDYEPEHYYASAGNYDITLIVGTDTYPACYDTMIKASAVIAEEPCNLIFPNAFIPDASGPIGGYYVAGDPSNKVFHPIHEGVERFEMKIYNRWGELVFRSDDINIGWDGYYRQKLVPVGVYVYRVWATCTNGNEINKVGDVTVFR